MADYESAYSGGDIDSAVAVVKKITSFMETLLDDETAAAAKNTLEIAGITLDVRVGCFLSNNDSDSEHDIDITAGRRRSVDNATDILLSSALVKKLDVVFSAGTDQGGLDTGAIATSTWYHVFLIQDISIGDVDILFSTSYSAPTMPSGYTKRRRIGSILTDGDANILPFIQVGDTFRFKTPVVSQTGSIGAGYTALSIIVPADVRVEAFGNVRGNATKYIQIRPVGCSDANPSLNDAPLAVVGLAGHNKWFCLTNTSQQVDVGVDDTINVAVTTEGWRDFLEDS